MKAIVQVERGGGKKDGNKERQKQI